MELFFYIAIVFCLSILFSFLGMGGAIIYVPLLYWLGMDLLTAIAIALLLNVVTTFSASITYIKKRMVDFHTAAPFILSSAIAAPFGAFISRSVPDTTTLSIFSLVVALAGFIVIFSKRIGKAEIGMKASWKARFIVGIILGLFIGTVAGMLGIGGGTFLVPVLLLLGFGIKSAPATSALVVLFSSLSGFLSHIGSLQIDLSLLAAMGFTALVGGQIGSRLMYLRHDKLRLFFEQYFSKILGMVLLLIAVMLQWSLIGK
ncbi:sulfite exporter TauE/SafE family protein [Methanococcoides orientis]|uniref:sulfite exporter TauE/SafE family protein n=1 Tax=Methanococcoides orientis TaxID=2822137 RepID=UPI001E5134F7|nr:sulfite exporter TauE/SafE family protein [Methanococcoides orientis]UGV41223.1 sulfite exporter TauE/SafE family protein [Methanococcoides orientis]